MKKAVILAGLLLMLGGLATVWASPLHASSPNLELQVNGIECTLDQIYDFPAPSYILNPEDCTLPSIRTALPVTQSVVNSSAVNAPIMAAQSIRPEGDQGIFENTRFESLARSVGIGNTSAGPARPIVAASALVGGTGFAVDAILFNFRFSSTATAFLRRRRQ
jgi:hypothetical protein